MLPTMNIIILLNLNVENKEQIKPLDHNWDEKRFFIWPNYTKSISFSFILVQWILFRFDLNCASILYNFEYIYEYMEIFRSETWCEREM